MIIDSKAEENRFTTDILKKHNLTFETEEQLTNFFSELFTDDTRFGRQKDNDDVETFDYFTDSDVIYASMKRAYPFDIRTREDLQNMSWWEFKDLFNCINTTASDRSSLRAREIPKDSKGKDKELLIDAQHAIRINKNLKFEY